MNKTTYELTESDLNACLFALSQFPKIPKSSSDIQQLINVNNLLSAKCKLENSEELSANVTVIISFTIKSSSFSLSSSFITIPENMPINSLIQPSLQIIGLYEQPLHYELICNDYCPFSMNNSSSTLTPSVSIDGIEWNKSHIHSKWLSISLPPRIT